MRLSEPQGELLLQLAWASIKSHLGAPATPPEKAGDVFRENGGVFVTLKKEGNLRGCIGNIEPVKPIWEGVRDNAINAAFHDYRFPPLKEEELESISLSVSILSKPLRLSFRDPEELLQLLVPHRDGVILKKKGASATFLPQVWQQLPEGRMFLGHLCRKAGLGQDCWSSEDVEVWVYQVESFGEEG